MPRAVTGVGPFIAPNNHDCKPGDAKASQDATPHEPPHRSPPHSKPHNPQRGAKTKRPPLDLPVPAPDGPQEIEATGVP